VQVEARSIKRA